ncbi:hypothetical protein SH528x_000681 [Novipirellula sp. SH528]|uniref:hypothetical protein n=1 Tax=Novipirellula sp. SH528 TaxID=3454466 RepID=UPI003F9F07F1
MTKRDHLHRLPPRYYQADAIVHWSITIFERRQGWISVTLLYRFRELMTHTLFRYGLACPIFCLMPDHFHMVWMGLCPGSDQLLAMKHFRKTVNDSLKRIGFQLQDQSYDHVFKEQDRREGEFRNACEYIARNPERAGMVDVDKFAQYKFSGCVVPGYPELRVFDADFWDRFDRVISFLRKRGLMQVGRSGPC